MRDLTLAFPQTGVKRKASLFSSRLPVNYLLLALIVILGLVYLFGVNSMSTKGLSIKKLQLQLDQLQAQQKTLQLKASDLQSINLIQSKATSMNFVPSTGVTYLKDSNFALK